MTEEYLLNDVPWDDEEAIVDREPESGGDGKKHFGFLRLYPLKVTKSFTKGDFVTIPGVVGGDYNEKDNEGNMKLKGWTKGGHQYLFVLVGTKERQDGSTYQAVKQLPSKLQRKGDVHEWADIVLPALKKLSNADRSKLSNEGVWAEWSDVGTGRKFKPDDGEEKEVMTWGSFKVYADKAAMKVAEKEFFSQFGENGNNATSIYPASWDGSVDDMIAHAKANPDKLDHAGLAEQLMLTVDGVPANTANGEEVNVKLVLSRVLDVPEPMIKL